MRRSGRTLVEFLPALTVVLTVGTFGCWGSHATPPPPAGVVPLEPLSAADRLYYDARSPIQDSMTLVVRNPLSWRDTWRRMTSSRSSAPQRPEIDFSRNMVVVVAAGRVALDQRLRVDSLALRKEMSTEGKLTPVLMVWYSLTESCGVRSATRNSPVEAVKAQAYDGTVRFVGSMQPQRCPGGA